MDNKIYRNQNDPARGESRLGPAKLAVAGRLDFFSPLFPMSGEKPMTSHEEVSVAFAASPAGRRWSATSRCHFKTNRGGAFGFFHARPGEPSHVEHRDSGHDSRTRAFRTGHRGCVCVGDAEVLRGYVLILHFAPRRTVR